MAENLSRGIRNHNPGNLRRGARWRGLVEKAQRTDKQFCQFISPEYGIRAMIITLRNYRRIHGLLTLREFISRWAPPVENPTDAYLAAVVHFTGVAADEQVDV